MPENPYQPPKEIEMILGSPPERDELVVQFFVKDGGRWAELYREDGRWLIEVYPDDKLVFDASVLCEAVTKALSILKDRLE